MRKNSPRKWLHACLDLLPVILIPVFMIYSHRHDISSNSSYTEQVPVYYQSNEVNSADDIFTNRIYYYSDNLTTVTYVNYTQITINKELFSEQFNFDPDDLTSVKITFGQDNVYLVVNKVDETTDYINIPSTSMYFIPIELGIKSYYPIEFVNAVHFTDFEFVQDYQEVVYTFDKDIMGAFMNNFNFTIDNYFNMGNVFNLTGVYQWFNTNIFNGNSPQVIYSVWNIALYELVMDLLFLLYGLFMWFIDIVQHLMDKPFKSIK